MNRHPPLLQAVWLNWSNCSLDDMYRSLLNIWNVSRSSFISSFLHCAGAPLNYGNTKGQAFRTVCAQGVHLGAPPRPSLPTPAPWLCVCRVIRCDTKTSLSSSLCQPAALHCKPALTAMTLQPDWTSDPPWPPAIEMVLKSTTITCRPLDYCINTLTWTQRFYLSASVPLSVFALYFLGLSDSNALQ